MTDNVNVIPFPNNERIPDFYVVDYCVDDQMVLSGYDQTIEEVTEKVNDILKASFGESLKDVRVRKPTEEELIEFTERFKEYASRMREEAPETLH